MVSDSRDLLVHFRKFTLEEILKAQRVRFGCDFLTKTKHDFIISDTDNAEDNAVRMKSVMIGLWLNNSLTEQGKKVLNNDRIFFGYTNTDGTKVMDGVAMLYLIYKRILPSSKVGVSNKKVELIGMHPGKFGGDVNAMITKMQTLRTSIENESGKVNDDFILHLFSACERSTNDNFQKFACNLRSDWESDNLVEGTTDSKLVDMLVTKWNNESSKNVKGGGSVADPANAKMMALFTT